MNFERLVDRGSVRTAEKPSYFSRFSSTAARCSGQDGADIAPETLYEAFMRSHPEQRPTPSDGRPGFGASVAIDRTHAIVRAAGDLLSADDDSVYVFRREEGAWREVTRLPTVSPEFLRQRPVNSATCEWVGVIRRGNRFLARFQSTINNQQRCANQSSETPEWFIGWLPENHS